MTGRILQVFGVIVGVVGSILSFVYGGEMISYDFVETGVGILLGGFFGSIIMAALFFAIGSTHIKVCNNEDMLIHERIARKKAAEGIDES